MLRCDYYTHVPVQYFHEWFSCYSQIPIPINKQYANHKLALDPWPYVSDMMYWIFLFLVWFTKLPLSKIVRVLRLWHKAHSFLRQLFQDFPIVPSHRQPVHMKWIYPINNSVKNKKGSVQCTCRCTDSKVFKRSTNSGKSCANVPIWAACFHIRFHS